MSLNSMIYIAEAITFTLVIIIGLIIFLTNKKKGLLIFLSVSLTIFIIAFGITFVTETPEMEVEEIVNLEAKRQQEIRKPKTIYHFQNVTNNVRVNGDFNFDKIGEYNVKYEIDTMFGTYSKDGKIRVIDTKPPEIILNGEEEYRQSYKNEFEEPGYKAIDEYDGDLTKNVKLSKENINENSFYIKYEIEDSSGNKTQKARSVTLIDDIAPVISLNGNENITVLLNNNYEEKGAKAEDEKEGDLTEKISKEGDVDTSKEGIYTIIYKVADSQGNEATKKRIVKVVKQEEYAQQNQKEGNGVIYLTFDDGPSTNITPKILDILKSKNVKATFFILNYNSQGEELVKREYAEGHTIGIHGYSHDYNQIYKSESAYMENLRKLQEKIKNSTGYNATITRFPGGSSNTVSRFNPGIMTRLSNLVLQNGFKYFDWNVSSGDAGGARNSEDIFNNVTKGLSKSRANVVLMHDFSSNEKVLDALPRIIDFGISNGYTFSRITENTPMVKHSPNN